MADTPQQWQREFKEMGAPKVRTALATKQWSGPKQAAARVWIENLDGQAWQSSRRDKPAETQSFGMRLRGSKFAKYAIPAVMFVFAISMLLKRLKAF